MANSEVARAEVILNGQKANATLKELENSAKALNAELRKLPTNSDAFAKKTEEFQTVKKRIGDIKQEIIGTQSAMGKFADWSNKYFQGITIIAAAFTGAALAIKGMVENAGKLSDSLANIRKTTGMTADEVSRLNSELKKIDTRTSREELRGIANVAGQLGIEKYSVFEFTNSIDKLNVALGDEIQGGAEGVATTMGTLRNVLTDMKTKDVSDDLLRIGNAINDLSASGFATAPVLADFANRIGGVGINLGLTSNEVLGISATMQELAISTERGGTAMVKILSKMTTNTGEFAKVAGEPLEDFTKLVNTDLYAAFVKVLEGSRRSGEGATVLGNMIKEMEISGIGAAEVFSKLGTNTQMLSQKVTMAGSSLQTTAGVLAEFKIKNETLGATLDKLGKDFNSLMSSASLISLLKSGVEAVVSLVAWLKVLPKTIKDNIVVLTLMSGTLLIYIASVTKSMQITILNNLLMKEGILLKIKDALVLETLIMKERLMNLVKSEGSIATKLATIAQWAWNAALAANPIGLVIAGITTLIAGIAAYNKYNSQAIANEKEKASLTVLLANSNLKLEGTYTKIVSQLRELNKLSREEKTLLEQSIDLKIKSAQAELLVFEAKQKSVGKNASKPTTWQSVRSRMLTPEDAKEAKHVWSTLNSKEAMGEYSDGIEALKSKIFQLIESKKSLTDVMYAEYTAHKITLKTQDALTEKLSLYQTALRSTVAGSEDFIRIQKSIKYTQIALAKFDNSDKSTDEDKKKSQNDALKSSYEKLGVEIKEYIALLQQQVVSDPKQAAITAKKIKRLQDEKAKIDALVGSLVDLKGAEGKTDYDQLNEDIKKNTDLLYQQVINDPEQAAVTAQRIRKLQEEKEKIDELVKSMMKQEDLMGLLDDRQETPQEEWDRTTEGLLGPLDGPDPNVEDPQMQAERESADANKWAKDAEEVLGYVSMVENTLGSLDSFLAARENQDLAKDEYLNKQKEKNLKARLNAGLITQKQYDAATAKNDADLATKKRKIEHDQAVRAKAMAVLQAGINVALGITSALSTIPAGFALAIITGILGAVQIAAILAAPVPQAAKGRFNVIGNQDGKHYSNVPYQESFTGIPGRAMLVNETGNEIVIDPKTTKNLMVNYPGVISAINFARVPQRATGSYLPENPVMQQSLNGESLQLLTNAIITLNANANKPSRSFVVYDDIRDSADTINEIEKNVKTG
ncbi:MAG: phage tail tape measure protein [Bacteroidetes bacterium]|nr:phage tail tape measure protein [Bacteroidota bacterium]